MMTEADYYRWHALEAQKQRAQAVKDLRAAEAELMLWRRGLMPAREQYFQGDRSAS